MTEPDRPSEWSLAMIFAPIAKKPWMAGVFLLFLFAGAVIGVLAFPPQWGLTLQVVFGLLLGLAAMLSLYLPRMIATDFDD